MKIPGQENRLTLVLPDQPDTQEISYHDAVVNALICHRTMLGRALEQFAFQADSLSSLAVNLVETLQSGHKVFVIGNGGSAAEAQHFAAELVGRFKRERKPYPVISLTTDTSILTAVANDYGYNEVFARQIQALGQIGDMLIAFSTSGESENLLRAAEVSRQCFMSVVAITGNSASSLQCLSDLTVRVPEVDTAVAQELHMIVTHVLCEIVESELASREGDTHP